MPVDAVIQAHVIAYEYDTPYTKLHRQVQRMEPAIASPPKGAELAHKQLVCASVDCDILNVPGSCIKVIILTKLQALVVRETFIQIPPAPITSIVYVTVRQQIYGIVDRDCFRFPFDFFKIFSLVNG